MKELRKLMSLQLLISNSISQKTIARWLSVPTDVSDDVWRKRNVTSREYLERPKLQPIQRPCLDENNVFIVRGMPTHANLIHNFLYTYYWTAEPSILTLQMDLYSPYLKNVTHSYATSGDRFLVFERVNGKDIMIGFAVSRKKYPWMINELRAWARATTTNPEKYKIYFNAYCLENPNFFKKYNVDYVYDVECISIADNILNIGVADLLLESVVKEAQELRYPLVQVVCGSYQTSKLCERCGLKRDWSMNYEEFLDDWYKPLFYPRIPFYDIGIYVKYFDPKKSLSDEASCLPPY